jgi:hypothetical protein
VDKEKLIRITVEPLEQAYQLLSADPLLSVSRNGSRSLYVKMADDSVPRVNALLVANGLSVAELSLQNATLEDIFLKLTSIKGTAPGAGASPPS